MQMRRDEKNIDQWPIVRVEAEKKSYIKIYNKNMDFLLIIEKDFLWQVNDWLWFDKIIINTGIKNDLYRRKSRWQITNVF